MSKYTIAENGALVDKNSRIAVAPPEWIEGNGNWTNDKVHEWMDAMDSLSASVDFLDDLLKRHGE